MSPRRLLCLSVAALAVVAVTACGSATDLAGAARDASGTSTGKGDPEPIEPAPKSTAPTDDPSSAPPTTSQTSPPLLELPRVIGEVRWFESPSRNIGCRIESDSVRCDIIERSYRPDPKPGDCDLDWGNTVAVGRQGGSGFVCVGDTVGGGPVILQYGTSTKSGDFGCTSRRRGMQCYNLVTGTGFVLSREQVLFL